MEVIAAAASETDSDDGSGLVVQAEPQSNRIVLT